MIAIECNRQFTGGGVEKIYRKYDRRHREKSGERSGKQYESRGVSAMDTKVFLGSVIIESFQ
jgi:hypothetical protein